MLLAQRPPSVNAPEFAAHTLPAKSRLLGATSAFEASEDKLAAAVLAVTGSAGQRSLRPGILFAAW